MPLPKPPRPEPPRITELDDLAPKFRVAVENILRDMGERGHKCKVFESLRTNERQRWLYGFGREYDDGRGDVTGAMTARGGWHYYGLAVDIVEDDSTPWRASQLFWSDLGRIAEIHGCKWGGRWKRLDLPHVQWGTLRKSPSEKAHYYDLQSRQTLWRKVGAL